MKTIEDKPYAPKTLDELRENRSYRWELKKFCEADKEFLSAERAEKKREKDFRDKFGYGESMFEREREYDVWKRKAVSFSVSRDFERADDVVRHNAAVLANAATADKMFHWRLYRFNALDWKGEEHSRGTYIARDVETLRKHLSSLS